MCSEASSPEAALAGLQPSWGRYWPSDLSVMLPSSAAKTAAGEVVAGRATAVTIGMRRRMVTAILTLSQGVIVALLQSSVILGAASALPVDRGGNLSSKNFGGIVVVFSVLCLLDNASTTLSAGEIY